MGQKLVMAVTNDRYEFPVFITSTVPQMAKTLGVSECTVYRAISGVNKTVHRRYKIIVVDINEEV